MEGHNEFNQLITNLPWNHQKILFLMISGWLEVRNGLRDSVLVSTMCLLQKYAKGFSKTSCFDSDAQSESCI